MEEIQFQKPELKDQERIRFYLEKAPSRSCERTFASVYLWEAHYDVKYAIVEDALIFRAGEGFSFAYPAGEPQNIHRALDRLLEFSRVKKGVFRLYSVTEEMFDQLDAWYPGQFQIAYYRSEADYVYETEALASLAGKKLHGKRNHINKFKLLCPDWSYEPLGEANIEECLQMAQRWRVQNGCDANPAKNAEICVAMNSLRLYRELKLSGGLIRAKGEVVAFCVGEPLSPDTYVVHIEKAYADVEGAYTMINQQFVQHECMGYRYVNREEDTGAEGLRKAKLSYHPAFLVNKGVVTRKISKES